MDEPVNHARPTEITQECFLQWRSPRPGDANPAVMNNPLWEWLIRTRLDAYNANELFHGPSSFDAGPVWCFQRFGQSATELPDGRTVFVGGEHEDYYDPDFCIYNDVVMTQPDGQLIIYGYPKDVFPPTDFHSATLVDDRIVLIGSLGYQDQRLPGQTQVLELALDTFAVRQIATQGELPGWIHGHSASLSADGRTIVVSGGMLDRGGDLSLLENTDDWELDLASRTWRRSAARGWQQWAFIRKDRKPGLLWHMRQALWYRGVKWKDDYAREMEHLLAETGHAPDLDMIATLYCLDDSARVLPSSEEEYNIFRVDIDGIVVRFKEDGFLVQAVVEGRLPESRLAGLQASVLQKLSALENAEWEIEPDPAR